MKTCPICKQNKNDSCFYRSSQRKDGLRCYCKECERHKNIAREPRYKAQRKLYRQTGVYRETKRQYYWDNRELVLNSNRKWRTTSKNGRLLAYLRAAKHRNIAWELSREDFFAYWQMPCFYCGDKIDTIGIDRIDNACGYTKDNVVSCCRVCNTMKLAMTQADFIGQAVKIAMRHKE